MRTFLTLMILASGLSAHAADYAADFNLVAGANGANGWTYGYTTALGGTFVAHSLLSSTPGVSANWYTAGLSGDQTPSAFKNLRASASNGVPAGQAGLHSGPSGEFGVARYTFGNAGTYDIAGFFGEGDRNAVSVAVLLNGASLFGQASTASQADFDLTASVGVGDTLDFVVGQGNDGYTFDSTPLSASIQAVPEPASFVALALSALGLLRRRKA